jgi:hypothetical protein
MISASAGVSFRVDSKNWLARMTVRLPKQRPQLYGETATGGSKLVRTLCMEKNTKKQGFLPVFRKKPLVLKDILVLNLQNCTLNA